MTQLLKGLVEDLDVFDFNLSQDLYSTKSLPSNILGTSGIVDDLLFDGAGDGSPLAAVYDDVLAEGGIVENLANGGGLGVEGVLFKVFDDLGL